MVGRSKGWILKLVLQIAHILGAAALTISAANATSLVLQQHQMDWQLMSPSSGHSITAEVHIYR